MKPVLVHFGGFDVTSYGASKALAALVAGWLIAKDLRRIGRDPGLAYSLTLGGFIAGFAGAKVNFLVENARHLSWSDLGGTGFTWYGGMIAGAAAVLVIARRHGIPASVIAGITAAPLAFAYAIGRIGCLLAGDGTYGKPSDLPWAMSFPHGTVPTLQRVHPTPLYEAIVAFALGILLWRLRPRLSPPHLFALFAVGMGVMRFLIEFLRLNSPVVVGLTEPQLWSLALIAVGVAVGFRSWSRTGRRSPPPGPRAPQPGLRRSGDDGAGSEPGRGTHASASTGSSRVHECWTA